MIIAAAPSLLTNPHVDLLVDALPAGTARVTIERRYNGIRDIIRDANGALTNGASSRQYSDWETPFGIPCTYTATARSAAGAQLGVAASIPVTLDVRIDWISDPLAPRRACAVKMISPSLESVPHATPGEIVQIAGSGLPLAVMGVPAVASSVALVFSTDTELQAFAIRQVLPAQPFLLRTVPEAQWAVPPLLYVAHPNYTDEKIVTATGRNHIAIDGIPVRPPVAPTALPARTYRDAKQEASSYSDWTQMYPSYSALRNGGGS